MTKPELLGLLAEKSGVSKQNVDEVFDVLIEVITEKVHGEGDTVSIPGLGTFKQKVTNARTGRNPRTGESVQIAAKKKVVFSAASALKK